MKSIAMPLTNKKSYRIINVASGEYLTRSYIEKDTTMGTPQSDNVVVKSAVIEFKKQIWNYNIDTTSKGEIYYRLKSIESIIGTLGIKSLNTEVTAYGSSSINRHNLIFEEVERTDRGYKYRIKLESQGYYLTQNGNMSTWTETANGNNSIWIFEEVSYAGSSSGGSVYLAIWSCVSSNSLIGKCSTISDLYKKCYGETSGDNSIINRFATLYNGSIKENIGKFNTGVDFVAPKGEGTTVKAPISGEVVYSNSTNKTLTILEKNQQFKYLFINMTDMLAVGTKVKEGDIIGKVSGIDINGVSPEEPYLQLEVHCHHGQNEAFEKQINSFVYPRFLVTLYDI